MIANPLPAGEQLDPDLHARVLAEALAAAEREGVRGRDITPFLLARFHAETGGESLRANIRLVLRNAQLAAQIAVARGRMTVVVLGDLMTDVVAWVSGPLAHASDTPAQITTHPGGGGANVAARLAAAGVPTRCSSARVGNDPAGRAAVEDLRAGGVRDQRRRRSRARRPGTVVVIVEPTGERTMLPDRGANAVLSPADLPVDELRAATHLHLSGYTLLDPGSRAAALVALEHAREAGVSVSVDPASAAPIETAGPRAFLDWVAVRRRAAPQPRGGRRADRRPRARGRGVGARARRPRGRDHPRRRRRAVVRRRAGDPRRGGRGAGARRLDGRRGRVHGRLARRPPRRRRAGRGARPPPTRWRRARCAQRARARGGRREGRGCRCRGWRRRP